MRGALGRGRRLWQGPGGVGEVLSIAYPLILSQMSLTLQVFVDRLFLTWYSTEAVAAAVTGVLVAWSVVGLCISTGEYVTTFIAQYLGADRPWRIGAALWQGIYFSLLAGIAVAALSPLAGPLFALAGHAPTLQEYETAYARILLLGAGPIVLMATLSSFFAGRGRTLPILVVQLLATALNALLCYLWIFGHAGFPRGGVKGAALATVTSQAFGAAVFLGLILRREHRRRFGTAASWRLEPALLARLLRYGVPAGLQFSMELAAFAAFMVIVGRLGTAPLAATGIAFNLNMIVFMPFLGIGIAVSSLVGRYLGADRTGPAERSAWSAFRVGLVYLGLCSALYLLAPRLLLAPYAAGADPAAFAEVGRLSVVLLRFVAVYSLFDMMSVIFAAALKGAGDTTYPLLATLLLSWGGMVVPAYVLCVHLGAGLFSAWTAAAAYIFCVGLLMLRRFRGGRWKSLRVIETPAPELEARTAPV
ncbi:MAG TPA: MATE family efflux transporter [Vicinamibacteria bacterium]